MQKQPPEVNSSNTNEQIEIKYLDDHKEDKRKKKRSVVILGDSMLKDIEPIKVKECVGNNEEAYEKLCNTFERISQRSCNFTFTNDLRSKSLVLGNVDLLIISKTKIDESFPLNQFIIEGFRSPFREDRNSQGGGLIIYVMEDIPCKR